jgi:hypothetical protein
MWSYVRTNAVSIFRVYAQYEPLKVFWSAAVIVALAAVGVFGGVGVVVRIALGATLPGLLLAGAISTALYAAIVWRFRSELELRSFSLRRRRKGSDAPPLVVS